MCNKIHFECDGRVRLVYRLSFTRCVSMSTTCSAMRKNILATLENTWAEMGSSSDNPSVYKYGQTDGSSVQTNHRGSWS